MKIKVLHLVGSFQTGGSEMQAVQLVQLLSRSLRWKVQVACLSAEGPLRVIVERLELGEIPAYPLSSFYNANGVRQLFRFARFLREQQIDIVQTHDFYTNVFGMVGSWLARVPVRIAARRETSGWRTTKQNWVERQVFRLAHKIVVNAEATREYLMQQGIGAEQIVIVHNGLNLERITPHHERPQTLAILGLQVGETARLVTIVANLAHPVKDHATFLRAARRVHEDVPEAHFVIAGDGVLTDSMRAFAKELLLEHNVHFVGRCERVAELLDISEVCVLSSRAEGFSNSILEYMGAARPVVATAVGGAREVVVEGKTGYLVEPGDAETMAAKIIQLLSDSINARAMGARGREIVEKRFSCQAQLQQTEQLYDQLLRQTLQPLASCFQSGSTSSQTSGDVATDSGLKQCNEKDIFSRFP